MMPELRPFVRALDLKVDTVGALAVFRGAIDNVEIVATKTDMGVRPAAAVCRELLDTLPIDHVVVAGVAGGVARDTKIGELVVPSLVIDDTTQALFTPAALGNATRAHGLVTTDGLLKREAFDRYRDRDVRAVDMETSAVAAVCDERDVPWSAFRAISDRIHDTSVDDEIFELGGTDGTAKFGTVARYLLRHPTRIGRLTRLGRGLDKATRTVTRAVITAIREHEFAPTA